MDPNFRPVTSWYQMPAGQRIKNMTRSIKLLDKSFDILQVIMGSSKSDKKIITTTYGLLPYAFTQKSLDDFAAQTKA